MELHSYNLIYEKPTFEILSPVDQTDKEKNIFTKHWYLVDDVRMQSL